MRGLGGSARGRARHTRRGGPPPPAEKDTGGQKNKQSSHYKDKKRPRARPHPAATSSRLGELGLRRVEHRDDLVLRRERARRAPEVVLDAHVGAGREQLLDLGVVVLGGGEQQDDVDGLEAWRACGARGVWTGGGGCVWCVSVCGRAWRRLGFVFRRKAARGWAVMGIWCAGLLYGAARTAVIVPSAPERIISSMRSYVPSTARQPM